MSERILALIPARGASKGIPRKNVMLVGGKPLIAYSILHAKASERINRVVVSTDDDEIARIAREWGAEKPFVRPPQYSQDLSPDIDVFRHALEWLGDHEGYEPELVVHLRPTGPVRKVELIDRAIDLLASHPEADAIRSVSVALQTPYKMWRITPQGYLDTVLRVDGTADCQSLPRQQLPLIYWQNAYVDVVRPRAILEKNSMWGTCAIPFMVEETLFELDYPENIPAIPVHVHLDFLQRPPQRVCEIVGDAGKVLYDYHANTVKHHSIEPRRETVHRFDGFDRNQMFLDELSHFLDCLKGEAAPMVDLRQGRSSMRIAQAALESLEAGRSVELN